jgi:hypothetical protein
MSTLVTRTRTSLYSDSSPNVVRVLVVDGSAYAKAPMAKSLGLKAYQAGGAITMLSFDSTALVGTYRRDASSHYIVLKSRPNE